MSRGPNWTEDEDRICKYMLMTKGSTDLEISNVLGRRNEVAVKAHRIAKGWVDKPKHKSTITPKIVVGFAPDPKPNRAPDLPDIGTQVAKLIEKQTQMEATLWAINCKLGDLIELTKSMNNTSKESLDLWRSIDGRSKSPTT